MSKTTTALFIILLIFIGVLLFVYFNSPHQPILSSLTKPFTTTTSTENTTALSLSTSATTIQKGQTVTVAVVIHSPYPHPELVQFELAYDPLALTIDEITPGSFFTNPSVVLQNIDPVAGRISYALRCPEGDCVNPTSPTLATITISINPYM